MSRAMREYCGLCDHRWMIDVEFYGEYDTVLRGCKINGRRKFSGVTSRACGDFSASPDFSDLVGGDGDDGGDSDDQW